MCVDIANVPFAILAGGQATRLKPITAAMPKSLVEVAGRPFIDHQLALLRQNGVRRVVLCLGHLGEMVERHLGDGSAHGLELHYSYDGPRLAGTAGALLRAAPLLGDLFGVLYGDSYLEIDYRTVVAAMPPRPALGLMTVLHNHDRWDHSNAVYRGGRVLRYDKNEASDDMEYIDYGLTLLRATVLEFVPPDRPADLADLYADMAERGQLAGYEVAQRFYEIGSPRGLADTRAYLGSRAA
jgi:NDP-sugar pyrophosphorylase family protein